MTTGTIARTVAPTAMVRSPASPAGPAKTVAAPIVARGPAPRSAPTAPQAASDHRPPATAALMNMVMNIVMNTVTAVISNTATTVISVAMNT